MLEQKSAPKDFGFGEDEAMMRDAVRKFLSEKLSTYTLSRLVAKAPEPVYDHGGRAPWDAELWSDIVALGWSGLAVNEEAGGADISMVGIAGIAEELGRAALPSPLIPTLSASLLLRHAGGDVAKRMMALIAGESATASLALTNADGSWEPADAPLTARQDGQDLLLSGSAHFVQDAFKVQFLVASARLDDKVVLCAVQVDAPGLTLEQDHIHDLTRDQATVHFNEVRVGVDAIVSRDAAGVLEAVWPAFLTLVAADLCGAAEWLLQTTVDYAKERVQFDRPIGFFQAVKHPLVDAMVDIDRARSLFYHAAAELDVKSPGAITAARMAKSAASDAAAFISNRAIQLHGGIGFTWEHALHIYFKRNMHNQALYGDGVYQRRKLADTLIGPIGAA
ncbi:acyl-CoA dehydrogenase family protein [Rhodoferax sp. OV413]|uniref:acyl-CoA dehydrogenase family protein n=1 Tax=Rhodoferax sp. OV413 TaxID=1855285 RepID=UPI0025D2D2AC|nr:acyl-CoA dehydrogenase family protein [Rhodoferax sp. OV413]